MRLPDPHPLDFDWRFSSRSIATLTRLVSNEPAICIGVPSVARSLQDQGCDITLLDRQPYQIVRNHLRLEVDQFVPDRKYSTGIVDPPWYPEELGLWCSVAARAVGPGGIVFASVWPAKTRPNAEQELAGVLSDVSRWADVCRDVGQIDYEIPHFEEVSIKVSNGGPLSTSPRTGELIALQIRQPPPPGNTPIRTEHWVRFVLNDYQLAIRSSEKSRTTGVAILPNAKGWIWPYVSKRAPGRAAIDIWSSEGEVASLDSPGCVIGLLRQAIACNAAIDFEQVLGGTFPDLLAWSIPRPPYRRMTEWSHPQ